MVSNRIDKECVRLCDALNGLDGVKTFESCSGHGQHGFFIAFTVDTVAHLRLILISIDGLDAPDRWDVRAVWANGGDAIYFTLEGPTGAFKTANLIAKRIKAEHAIRRRVWAR